MESVQTPTNITEKDNQKEINKNDIDVLLDNASNAYISLASLLVSRMETLEILSPVVDQELLKKLEIKCAGLTKNLQKLEEDLIELKTDSESISKLLFIKENSENEDEVKKADLELLPKFEALIYRTGDISKGIDSLSEYYFINIQAVVDSLESNAREKHKKLAETLDKIREEGVIDEQQ